MYCLLFADVVVANFVEIDEAHIVATDLADILFLVLNVPAKVILGLTPDIAELKRSRDIVLFVLVNHFANKLMAHGSEHDVVKQVVVIVELNRLSILELDDFAAFGGDVGAVHASFGTEAGPAGQLIILIRAFN